MRIVPPPPRQQWQALELETLDVAVLRRYWLGTVTHDEIAQVEAWFDAKPGRRAWHEQFQQGLATDDTPALSSSEITRRTAAVLQAVGEQTRRAGIPSSRTTKQKQDRSSGTNFRRTMWYAAAGALVGAAFLMLGRWSEARRMSTTLSARASVYATASGERATITLPDGSVVLLNVASRLQVPADYAAGDRVVRLTGEALFTVAHQGGTPFTVLAGPSTTRVLGTSFVVRDYATDTTALIAVRDGRVAVGHGATSAAVVVATEQIAVSKQALGAVQPADSTQFSFATGVLTLKDVRFPDAIVELNRWYDADIRLGDASLAAKGVTGEFAAGSLSELTELLKGSFNVRVVRTGRVLTLYAR